MGLKLIYKNYRHSDTYYVDEYNYYQPKDFLNFKLNLSDTIEFDGLWEVKEDFNLLEKYQEYGLNDLDFFKSDNFDFKKGEIIALEVKDNSKFLECRHQIIRSIIGLYQLENFKNIQVKFLLIMKDPICESYKQEIIELKEYIKDTFKNYELIVISLLTTKLFGKDTISRYSDSQKHKIFSEENNKIIEEKFVNIKNEMNTNFQAVEQRMGKMEEGMKEEMKGMKEEMNKISKKMDDFFKNIADHFIIKPSEAQPKENK